MSPLAIGPIIAFLGIIAAFAVIRTKAQTKKSMYRSLRETRAADLTKARSRASEARAAQERAILEQEAGAAAAESAEKDRLAAAQAAAAAPPVPTSTAPIPQEPGSTPPPAAPAEPPKSGWDVGAPAVPGAALGEPGKASWEVVEPAAAEPRAAEPAATSGGDKASWELATAERKRDSKKKTKEDDIDEAYGEKESLAQVILSYAGLVAALFVILLGILFMVGARATS